MKKVDKELEFSFETVKLVNASTHVHMYVCEHTPTLVSKWVCGHRLS